MAVKTSSTRSYVSDISGSHLADNEHVRATIKGEGRSWILDAALNEEIPANVRTVRDLLELARETTGMGRNFNGNSTPSNN